MNFENGEKEDLFVNIINDRQKKNSSSYDTTLESSLSKSVIPYKPKKVEKPSNYFKIISSVVLIMALGFSTVKIKEEFENREAINDVTTKMAVYVTNNTNYGDYNPDAGEFYWWYDIDSMAKAILDSTDYDIDTRIYGCFRNLKEYKRIATMDELFMKFQKIFTENPTLYDENIVASCNFHSFEQYLDSKGLTLDEYTDKMAEVLESYGLGNPELATVKVTELNNNGGSR